MEKVLYNSWTVGTNVDVEFTYKNHTFNVITTAEVS